MSFPEHDKAQMKTAAEALVLGLSDDVQAAAAGLIAATPHVMPIAFTGEPTYDIYVRRKNRLDGFRIHRNTSKTELTDLLRESFGLEAGTVVLRHGGAVMSMSAMAPNTKEDPYMLDVLTGSEERRVTRKNNNTRRYTVDDKLAVQDPGNKHYKNEQNALKWGKENLKDMGGLVISLSMAIRMCRHLRTLQSAFNLNLTGLSLADLSKESLQNFVREAARFVKGDSRRTRKVDETRVTILRQHAPGNSIAKLFDQLNQIIRRSVPAEVVLPDDNELAFFSSKISTRIEAPGIGLNDLAGLA